MLRIRIIPCLQLVDESLVKTVRFKDHGYIGDPINTVRIFNELEVDELCFLDIRATIQKRTPNMSVLRKIANECFMPLSYGGGIQSASQASEILNTGFEKVVLNSVIQSKPEVVTEISSHNGSQSVIGSIDVKKNFFGKYQVYTHDGTRKVKTDPVEYAVYLESLGVGEILLTSIDREGAWQGYDTDVTKAVSERVSIPVIASGGAGSVAHIRTVVQQGKASAVALGSMVVYQQKGMGVLVNFPDKKELTDI